MSTDEALTPEQHQTHGARIQAAGVAIDALIQDLMPVQDRARQALATAVRVADALTSLRAALEDLALQGAGGCTYETPSGDREDYYYPATQEWLDRQQVCPTCQAPKSQ